MRLIKVMKVRNKALEKINLIIQSGIRIITFGAGSGLFYYGDWITKEGVAICSCNDGLRPVIMKVERTDEEATINYEPVRE